jgi:hypothetical protein
VEEDWWMRVRRRMRGEWRSVRSGGAEWRSEWSGEVEW